MALSFVTTEGTLIIPGAYPVVKVQADNSGLGANGIQVLVGEADAGPKWDLETDLEANVFGPDQVAAVVAKYKSGNLVEAFRAAAVPANDPNITGGPASIILVKTNSSAKAARNLVNTAAGVYGQLVDRSYGKLGNLIQSSVVAAPVESLPTTGSFTFIPPVGTVNIECRMNGGAALPVAVSANMTPTAFVAAVTALAGVLATGGVDRVAHSTTGTLSITATGLNVVIVTSTTWQVTPSVGDTLVIPATSVLGSAAGVSATGDNVGAYVVTAATSTQINATKLSDAGQTGAVIGAPVACVTEAPIAVGGTPQNNLVVYSPAVITLEPAVVLDGIGKSLEIAQLVTGTDLMERCAFQLNTTPVTWVSKAALAAVLTSVAEYALTLNVSRQADSITEALTIGGEVGLTIRYTGTTATITITSTTLTTSVTGGAGTNLSLTLADFSTIADLAARIATEPGYSAAAGSAVLGQLPPTALDRVTAQGICSSMGSLNGRVKIDAYRFYTTLAAEGVLTQFLTVGGADARADSGLPAVQAAGFLAGGTKGGTLAADVVTALAACELVTCNFVNTLFSRDASADITDGLTESSSTYTIDGVNASLKNHALAMRALKRRKPRQVFASKKTTFTAAREAAASMASALVALTFQDVKLVGGDGTIRQFQPWMGGVIAAAMQAAGFYRAIFAKGVNISGALQAARDFDDRNDSQVEQALKAGLLVLKRQPGIGYGFVSDQTTYSKDSNFVYNSIQAMYAADLVSMGTAVRMERAFLGQSVADVSASLAKSYLDSIMTDMMRLKLIAASSDAPKGYKDAVVQISGPVMLVSLNIKLAGAIYFIPITFLVSQVQQSA